MNRQYSLAQYRTIDLSLFAVILLVFEFLVVSATKWFPNELYTISVVGAVTAIVMMRWGPFAAIHAVWGGAVSCFCVGAAPKQYLIFCIGNLASLLALLLIKLIGSEKIRTDALLSLTFGFSVQALMMLGRMGVSMVTGNSLGVSLDFVLNDVLSIIFTLVIVWIVRHLDGMFENQKSYLLRLQKEREKERGEDLE